jgi:NHL repeat-containing protein
MSDEYLFTRRTFLQTAAATTAGLTLGSSARAAVKFGEGKSSYTLDEEWGKLPAGMNYGFGCALVVDSKDRIWVTSRSPNACVVIFDSAGKILETWTKDIKDRVGYDPNQYAATAHGLYWSKEGDHEFLYWTENVDAPKGKPRIGARVYKTDLNGKILFQIGNVDKETETSRKFEFTNPTDVAVAANGDIYVVDGYGNQKLHRFDKNFKHLSVTGGRGKLHGEFNTCHGVWVNTLKKEPELYIADRHNDRVEVFSLDLAYKRTVGGVRNPCCFYQFNGQLYIPDLAARVTILDENDKVVAQLGDGLALRDKKEDPAKHPEAFFFPHALTVDSKGNLYVIEWLPNGRPRKLAPAGA